MTWYLEAAATEELEGPNWTPPTIGNFLSAEKSRLKRLREADAFKQVAREAKEFHERNALKHGVHTNRGMAHLKAAMGYTREAAGRLQEMFAQGGDPAHMDELPPKAIIKANKAAMKFHQGQAQKAGLDSDVGHAHIAAMEHHGDILQKAKQLHQQTQQQQSQGQQPMQASAEGGPGSGRHKGVGRWSSSMHDKPDRQGYYKGVVTTHEHPTKGRVEVEYRGLEGSHGRVIVKDESGKKKFDGTPEDAKSFLRKNYGIRQKEASPGFSGKASPVPVPKKSEQPSEDIRQNKPPIGLNPQDANKPGAVRQLQQNETMGAHAGIIKAGGPGSGRHKGGGKSLLKHFRSFKSSGQNVRGEDREESREARIRSFEADAMDDIDYGKRTLPPKVSKQMGDDLIHRSPRTKRESQHVSPKDQEPTPQEGYVDKRYSGLKQGVEARDSWPEKQRRMHKKFARNTRESNRQRFPREAMVDLRDFYKKPERLQGWRGGVAFSPTVSQPAAESTGNFSVKEF